LHLLCSRQWIIGDTESCDPDLGTSGLDVGLLGPESGKAK
jgi:hypothetical protein